MDAKTLVRRGGKSLTPALKIIEQCMSIVSIIPQGAEISSLVIGGLKAVISVSMPVEIQCIFNYGPVWLLQGRPVAMSKDIY